MVNKTMEQTRNEKILIENLGEENKTIKYILNLVIALGSIGFLIVGISSYKNITLIPFLKEDEIIFFPQGLTMLIYGFLGTLISINQYFVILSHIGEGFNEFNKETGEMRIFRKGLPGKNNDINLTYSINDIVRNLQVINLPKF